MSRSRYLCGIFICLLLSPVIGYSLAAQPPDGVQIAQENRILADSSNYFGLPEIIDPNDANHSPVSFRRDFASFFGGNGTDTNRGTAIDPQGNIIVVGTTSSVDLPVTLDASQPDFGGAQDLFLAKFSPDGQDLLYCSYIGGSDRDFAMDVAVDDYGFIAITGGTSSEDFPLVQPFQETLNGSQDCFVLKIRPDCKTIMFSTLFGGSGDDSGYAVDIDLFRNVVILSQDDAGDFPLLHPLYEYRGSVDLVVAKFDQFGVLIFSTYIGGMGFETAGAISFDLQGNIIVAGSTNSYYYPLVNPHQDVHNGQGDVFLTKLRHDGQEILLSTFLGGEGFDLCHSIAIRVSGNIILSGVSFSEEFPVSENAYQTEYMGDGDVFLTEFKENGTLEFSTLLGGGGFESATEVTIDPNGSLIITGDTNSHDFPLVHAFQNEVGGNTDSFIAMLSPDAKTLRSSSFLGGADDDFGLGIIVDDSGSVFISGHTHSADFETVNAYQNDRGRGNDIFICRMTLESPIFEIIELPFFNKPEMIPLSAAVTIFVVLGTIMVLRKIDL